MLVFLLTLPLVQTEGHAKASEEEEDKAEIALSFGQSETVLGLLVLLICLYRLLNAKRQETREISWKMLSGTISIFAGVVSYSILSECYKAVFPLIELAPGDSFREEFWLARFWILALYLIFVCEVSYKACIGPLGQGKEQRLDIIEGKEATTEGILPELYEVLAAKEKRMIIKDGRDAGKTAYKSIICSMTGSLFWAHAIGFAGIDGWNMSQQQWCCVDDWSSEEEWKCEHSKPVSHQIAWSLVLMVKQIGMYYLMVRVAGIFWRFVKLRFIEAKHFHLAKWEGDIEKRLTKRTTIFHPWQWEEWTEEREGSFVEFDKAPAGNGKVSYTTTEKGCPYPYHADQTSGCHIFDFPKLWECTYKAGEDTDSTNKKVSVHAVPVHDEIVELWDDIRKDGENDFFAMGPSFLLVQTLRLAITQSLPNKDEDEEVWDHSWRCSLALASLTAVFLFLAFHAYAGLVDAKEGKILKTPNLVVNCVQKVGDFWLWGCVSVSLYLSWDGPKPPEHLNFSALLVSCILSLLILDLLHDKSCLKACSFLHCLERKGDSDIRAIDIFVNFLLLSASWSAMFATQWMLAHSKWSTITLAGQQKSKEHVESLLTINVALWVTGAVFLGLWLLNVLLVFVPPPSNLRVTHKGAFDKINTSLGLLIGFVWEAEFDKAVEHIGDRIEYKRMFKIGAGLVVLLSLLPVWFNSIIPMTEEQGWKFGFVFRRLHARLGSIHDEAHGPDRGDGRSEEHKRHFSEHQEQIKDTITILGGMLSDLP